MATMHVQVIAAAHPAHMFYAGPTGMCLSAGVADELRCEECSSRSKLLGLFPGLVHSVRACAVVCRHALVCWRGE
jgi:hypothetical protein